ncbi:N-acetylmuramoyl-L-alanine amidase [Lachnospiraceae bacterium]|nr:N-acetylmuramoyl-L-alanine amidase [Lachnospiraceae bacterium]
MEATSIVINMNRFIKISVNSIACFLLFCLFNMRGYAAQPVVVVLDAGHGGENLGAQYNGYTEKDMTLTVASAMKEELEKYEGIEVHMTRSGDKDMSLEERAEFAASKNADFLFCLHFNSSLERNLFGSEVWISAFGEEYQKGYGFASAELDLLEDMGLYPRGIKTRMNDDGEDYYGIIRHSTARGIPSALIEHCHLDHEKDMPFYTSKERLKQLGVLDATAVAKYYGLKSEVLGVDYSSYRKEEPPFPAAPVKPDLTEPDVCTIDVDDVNEDTGDVTVSIYAADYDSYILYYSYSWDGGKNFSELQAWEPRSKDILTFMANIPSGTVPDLVVKVYNKYDISSESNHVYLPSMLYGEEEVLMPGEEKPSESQKPYMGADAVEAGIMTAQNSPETLPAAEDAGKQAGKDDDAKTVTKPTILYFLQVAAVCSSILLVLVLLAGILLKGRRSKKKRRRKK